MNLDQSFLNGIDCRLLTVCIDRQSLDTWKVWGNAFRSWATIRWAKRPVGVCDPIAQSASDCITADIKGLLQCSGNAPSPTDAGVPNTVGGRVSGQCAELTSAG